MSTSVSERAYRYKSSGASDLIEMPAEILPRESEARREMLETLSEFDDTLLEQLIEDVAPEKSLIYRDLHDEFGADQISPVLIGAGDRENGVRRLLKALRHDAPFVAETAKRRDLPSERRRHGRVLQGPAPGPCRQALALPRLVGHATRRPVARRPAHRQPVPAVRPATRQARRGQGGRDRGARQGRRAVGRPIALGRAASRRVADFPPADPPVFALALTAKNRNDEVKLSGALHKIAEEDPSLAFEARAETHELLIKGQGEMHLKVAVEKLAGRYNVAVETAPPQVAYRETIQGGASSMRATSARPAGTASSPTSRSRSGRCRAARASASSTRSWAAWCRATSSPRSRKACASTSRKARSASRWSISR